MRSAEIVSTAPAGLVDDPLRLGREPLGVARDKDQVVAAPREAVGIDSANPCRSAGDEGGALVSMAVVSMAVMGVAPVWLAVIGCATSTPFRN